MVVLVRAFILVLGSILNNKKISLAEFRKSLKESSEYDSCSAVMFSSPKGACDVSLSEGWYIHYGWIRIEQRRPLYMKKVIS